MPIIGQPLRSTAIAYVQYDTNTETLTVDFVNGRSYTHEGVPQDVVDRLVNSPSPGREYNESIKGSY